MKLSLRIALLAAVTVLLSGCCACRTYQKRTRRPLVETRWQLVRLGGKSIQPEAGSFTVVFAAGGALTGTGACNRLSAHYEADDTRAMKIGRVAATRMACPDLELEREFVAAIESTTHYDMDGPMLMLLSDGELRAVLQALPDERK